MLCRADDRTDVHEYHVDTFMIGDDWEGKFDFLNGCAGGPTGSGRDYTGVELSQ